MTTQKNTNGTVYSNDQWELYEVTDCDFYGNDIPVTFARPRNNPSKNGEDRTGFPQTYRDCDIYRMDWNCYSADMSDCKTLAFSFFNKFEEWAEEGKGLYIWSHRSGSGKTFLAACIAKSVMLRTQKIVKYITFSDYMDKIGDEYKAKDSLYKPSKIYRECSLLVLDDLGTQLKNEWNTSELFRLIDQRSSNKLPTIITSDYSLDEIPIIESESERLRSRIMSASIRIHMPEESIRSKKAAAEEEKFTSKVI